jgi:hypothetical protein
LPEPAFALQLGTVAGVIVGPLVAAIDNVASIIRAAIDANAASAGDMDSRSGLRRAKRHGLHGRSDNAKTEQGEDSYEQRLYRHERAR